MDKRQNNKPPLNISPVVIPLTKPKPNKVLSHEEKEAAERKRLQEELQKLKKDIFGEQAHLSEMKNKLSSLEEQINKA